MDNYWKKAAKENPDNPFIQGHAEAVNSEVSSTGLLERLRRSCGEISCDECNEDREEAVKFIERVNAKY